MKNNAVLIIGGYGVVGAQIAQLFNQRNPEIPLIIAGRNREKAEKLAATLKNASAVEIDVNQPGQIKKVSDQITTVITAVNDPHDLILSDAIHCGVSYLDITRWTARVRDGIVRASIEKPTRPVVFSSAWMAGVASLVTQDASEEFASIKSVDIDILYSLSDKAGPNSVEYIDQLGTPFDVVKDGNLTQVLPMTDPNELIFPSGFKGKTFRFDTPDQLSLPITLGADSVSARIGYDDNSSAALLSFLVRSGIWNILNRPMFTKLRRSILYNPGSGGAHEIVISISGSSPNGDTLFKVISIVDKKGQTHLTAIGSVIQLERILGVNGNSPMSAGVWFPEHHPDVSIAMTTLREHGVEVNVQSA